MKIFKKFSDFLKFFKKVYRNSREILGKNLKNFGNIDVYGFGAGALHQARENIKKLVGKINGNRQDFQDFHEFLAHFDLKTLILIKIKGSLMEI